MRFAVRKIVDAIKRGLGPIGRPLLVGDQRRIFDFEIDGERYYLSLEGTVARRWVVRPAALDYLYQIAASAHDLDECLEAFARGRL